MAIRPIVLACLSFYRSNPKSAVTHVTRLWPEMEQFELCGFGVDRGGVSETLSLGEATSGAGREVGIVSLLWKSETVRWSGAVLARDTVNDGHRGTCGDDAGAVSDSPSSLYSRFAVAAMSRTKAGHRHPIGEKSERPKPAGRRRRHRVPPSLLPHTRVPRHSSARAVFRPTPPWGSDNRSRHFPGRR